MIDLHTHSNASDGNYSPSSLIEEAAKRGITALALTDHDTINGLEEAANAALKRKIRFIPGIELEITRDFESLGDFHLLGLGINHPTRDFRAEVEKLARLREERNLEIVGRMNEAGIDVSYDEIKAIAKGTELQDLKAHESDAQGPKAHRTKARELKGRDPQIGKPSFPPCSIGRLHFAVFLVKKKVVKNLELAFSRYLSKGKPFYIPKAGLKLEQAVKLIHESGGIAVLAHPMSLYLAWGRLPDFIKDLKDRGLDGLEAWHPNAKVASCRRLEALGEKLDLCITAGSDFHGETRLDRKLGITAGKKKIDESFLENIPALAGSL